MAKYVMGLDVGTGAIHCLLADSRGTPVAVGSAPMRYFVPEGCSSLAREFDPEATLGSLGDLVREVLAQEGVSATDLLAVGITSQRQGVVFLDESGKELYAGPSIDLRALFQGAAMDEELSDSVYWTTGHCPSFLLAPARLRWHREHRPEVYSRTRTILTIAGWLAYRLTGSLVSEPSLECETGLLDIEGRTRPRALLDALELPLSLLPPLSQNGNACPAVAGREGREWGLRGGTSIVVAGPDTQCGLLGMGLVREGQAGAVIGWSGALQVLTSRPCRDQGMRTWAGCYPADGLWVAESNLGDAGNAYRWLRDTLLGSEASFEEVELLARDSSGASDGVLAFMGPGAVSSFRAGLKIGGLFFPSPVSFQETSRGQLFRAALENVAYSVKANLAILTEVAGLDVDMIYLGGGMSSSRTLATTLASVLELPVRRSMMPDVSARGAALAASASVEPGLTLMEAAQSACDDYEEVHPGTAGDVAYHQEHYQHWLSLYKRLDWD